MTDFDKTSEEKALEERLKEIQKLKEEMEKKSELERILKERQDKEMALIEEI
jgi:thiamine biosynthesis lipoprotein ApbE